MADQKAKWKGSLYTARIGTVVILFMTAIELVRVIIVISCCKNEDDSVRELFNG